MSFERYFKFIYSGIVLDVNNYANENKINGYDLNKNNSILCTRIYNSTIQSKLLVSPCFLPNEFAMEEHTDLI